MAQYDAWNVYDGARVAKDTPMVKERGLKYQKTDTRSGQASVGLHQDERRLQLKRELELAKKK